MKRFFVCLANSKKHTGRCVAGIELVLDKDRCSIVRDRQNPHWIRTVSDREHGEVSSELAGHLNLLDIVEFEAIRDIPKGYQSENILYDEYFGFNVVSKIHPSVNVLDKLVSQNYSTLFLNRGKAVPADRIDELNYSLVFIKPKDVKIFTGQSSNGRPQVRSSFTYYNTSYDFPITDIDFLREFSLRPDIFLDLPNYYFTISLGLEFQSWHTKLIAGVICL